MKNPLKAVRRGNTTKVRFNKFYDFALPALPFPKDFYPCEIVRWYSLITNLSATQVYSALLTLNPKVIIHEYDGYFISRKAEKKLIKILTGLPRSRYVSKDEVQNLIKKTYCVKQAYKCLVISNN